MAQTDLTYAAALAQLRSDRHQFTGEDPRAAQLGAPLDHSAFGLDICDAPQRRLRALLALGLLNDGQLGAVEVGEWALTGLIAKEPVFSPRPDHLAIVVCMSYNSVRHLVPNHPRSQVHRLPGLRLEQQVGGTYLLRHLPTGASLSVTDEPTTRPDPASVTGLKRNRLWRTDVDVTSDEQAALGEVPPMTDAAEVLLAGLLVRFSLRDPAGRWSLANWDTHPLDRPLPQASLSSHRLWGHGERWMLEWSCDYPSGADVAAALTDPKAGIVGAKAVDARRGWDIVLDGAVLALRHRRY
ncbi:hypothetical protein [Streptomyces sp. N35]|uniref:hypothetical protein n=1 Tax=Streptomyces sp. N35 TaxID=2795730 RepID=UPI0018F2FA2D|nr:hypothetical protein [Streptomyces sp. N35]